MTEKDVVGCDMKKASVSEKYMEDRVVCKLKTRVIEPKYLGEKAKDEKFIFYLDNKCFNKNVTTIYYHFNTIIMAQNEKIRTNVDNKLRILICHPRTLSC